MTEYAADASVSSRYELDCTDCTFHEIVTGRLSRALETGDEHREQMDAGPTDHFINIHRRD